MNKQAALQEVYNKSFNDELEKIAFMSERDNPLVSVVKNMSTLGGTVSNRKGPLQRLAESIGPMGKGTVAKRRPTPRGALR